MEPIKRPPERGNLAGLAGGLAGVTFPATRVEAMGARSTDS